MDPPCLLVGINATSETFGAILSHERFGVSLLGSAQDDLALRFAGRDGAKGDARFTTAAWDEGILGVPLLQSAIGVFECVLHHHQMVGTRPVHRQDRRDKTVRRRSPDQFSGHVANVAAVLSGPNDDRRMLTRRKRTHRAA